MKLAIREHVCDYRMKRRHLRELVFARRARAAGRLLLLGQRYLKLIEQNGTELFRRAHVELAPRRAEYPRGNFPELLLILPREFFKIRRVQKNAGVIHALYNGNKWHLDVFIHLLQAAGLFKFRKNDFSSRVEVLALRVAQNIRQGRASHLGMQEPKRDSSFFKNVLVDVLLALVMRFRRGFRAERAMQPLFKRTELQFVA